MSLIPGPAGQRRPVEQWLFLILLAAVSTLFVLMLTDFLKPVFWAITLGILFQPVQMRLECWLRGRSSLAALLSLLLIVVTVLAPALLLGSTVIREAVMLFGMIERGEIDVAAPLRWVEAWWPEAVRLGAVVGIEFASLKQNLSSAAMQVGNRLAVLALSVGQNAARFGMLFVLMLYLLFFVLRDGRRMRAAMVRALPLGNGREQALLDKFAEVLRATVKGTLVIGLLQGLLGGLAFWALGLPAPAFWGSVMVLLSILPMVGSALVWGPAAVLLMLGGAWIKGLVLLAFGAFFIGILDNLLRPILVGRDTRMPDYLILLATLGGLGLFGMSGVIIGPIIAALFLAAWSMFALEHQAVEPAA